MPNSDIAAVIEAPVSVTNLGESPEFLSRAVRYRESSDQVDTLRRLARVFAETPEKVLQELSDVAMDLCHADSAGVSLETKNEAGEPVFHWVATTGTYAPFLNAMLPRHLMPCASCVDRGCSQLVRVGKAFFEELGVEAEPITDGMLIPWAVDGIRGTIWILAHGRNQAFDKVDHQTMESLANFAAMAVRHQRQQTILMRQSSLAAAASMANDLAHQINNPLQSVANILYMAEEGFIQTDAKSLSVQLREPVERLSFLVKRLLSLPGIEVTDSVK